MADDPRKWQADKTTHATVSRLNEEYSTGERNDSKPVESAFTAPASSCAGVDPYAAFADGDAGKK